MSDNKILSLVPKVDKNSINDLFDIDKEDMGETNGEAVVLVLDKEEITLYSTKMDLIKLIGVLQVAQYQVVETL